MYIRFTKYYKYNIRKQYCGKGYTYDPTKNKFIAEKIYPSWALDVNDDWRSPVTEPTIKTYGSNDPLDRYNISWNEENLKWIAKDSENPANNFNWDASALTWVPA